MNPNTGRFWTMDSFEGNQTDPLSLHKYLYGADNPVNRIDPSGRESLVSISATITLMTQLTTHELRGAHAILSAAERMFGADDQTHNLIYTLDIIQTTTDTTSLVTGGAAIVGIGYKAIRYGVPAIIRGGLGFARYLNALAKDAKNGKLVALGLDSHLGDWEGTINWQHWINSGDPERLTKWKAMFGDVMSNPNNKFIFILDDVDVWPGVQRAASGRGQATDWELLMIKENQQWWDRIAWTMDGKPVPNPFK